MTKKDRELIRMKYEGRCAYCGCELQKGWHVDEILPVRRGWQYVKDKDGNTIPDKIKGGLLKEPMMVHPERLNIENQVPACASCNINKHSESVEDFRKLIAGFKKHLNEINTQYKISKRYGLIIEVNKPVVFYFETIKNKEQCQAYTYTEQQEEST